MAKQRTFDWDEAARLYWGGMRVSEIAARFGVHASSVRRAVIPGELDRTREYRARSDRREIPCSLCGDPMRLRSWKGGARWCVPCEHKRRVTTVRETTLLCAYCREWLPDNAFYRTSSQRVWHRRFRASTCKACMSAQAKRRRGAAKNV